MIRESIAPDPPPVRQWSPAASSVLGVFLLMAMLQLAGGRPGPGIACRALAVAYVPAGLTRAALVRRHRGLPR